jgi:HTH-type transcriptional regulator, competence development regulator
VFPMTDGPSVQDSFGRRIKRKRRELGVTQRELAGRLKIDFTYLSKLENDRGEPPGEKTVRNLAAELGDDAEELLALAGKLPDQLRTRAQQDVAFARLLRRLPGLPDDELQDIYRQLKINEPEP